MLTDKDYNIAKKVVENFDLPADLGCDQESDEFNSDIIYNQLMTNVIGTCYVENGISKAVIIPENQNFVIKIPLTGQWYYAEVYNEETDEYEYEDDPAFEEFENANAPDESDYCWDELLCIEEAEENGFGAMFPETDFLGEVNGTRFYIQEKVQTSREFTPQVSEDSRSRSHAMDWGYNYGGEIWRAAIIEQYGEDFWIRFCDWARSDGHGKMFDDMHSGNYGYLNGRPIILDASGFDS